VELELKVKGAKDAMSDVSGGILLEVKEAGADREKWWKHIPDHKKFVQLSLSY
jgi:hypothetical protein